MRPLEGDQIGNARCDMGAIEVSTAPVATYLVNLRNTDTPDASLADPNCDADLTRPGNQCTLRAAVMQANHKPGPDRIQFDHALGDAPFQLSVCSQAPNLRPASAI
ncbi:MAG: hypothetical protein IPK97_12490 [Ahniella sp.]|nr:hypothetical protein [Ahniella sp.]